MMKTESGLHILEPKAELTAGLAEKFCGYRVRPGPPHSVTTLMT
jgi:hypothetical protein